MEHPFNISDLLKGTDIKTDLNISVKGIAINSKDVENDYIFFAIKGEKTDGNIYAKDAIKKGAKVIITDSNLNFEIPTLKTADIHKTLSIVCKNFYSNPSSKLSVTAITGTKGKTTTSILIQRALNKCQIKTGLIGTINYQTHKRIISEASNTTPLANLINILLLEMLKDGDESCIMEISSHSLKLKRVDDIEFDRAVFTNLQSDHLDFHKTIQDYANSKLMLFKLLNSSPKKNKFAIINEDDNFSVEIKKILNKDINIITYSILKDSLVTAKNIDIKASELSFDMVHNNKKYNFKTNLTGIHNIYNILALTGTAISYNIEPQFIRDIIESIDFIPGRLEKIDSKKGFYVYIDYAHTEESLRQVLKTFNSIPHSRIITVFGCGGDRDRTKRAPMGKVASELSDYVIITSDNPRTEDPLKIISEIEKGAKETSRNNYIIMPDRKEAIIHSIKMASKMDIVLIAGKGHENYQIIGNSKIHFSDREIVIEAINKK